MKIKVYYTTGNSFGTYETSDVLDFEWKNENVVKENIKAINEHDEFVHKCFKSYYTNKAERDTYLLAAKNKSWFVEGEYMKQPLCEYSIKLKLDNGKMVQMQCPWIGYFETLQYAEGFVDIDD